MLIRLALLLAVASVAACSQQEAPRRTAQERVQASEARMAQTPAPRTYRYTDGELRVIEAPVRDAAGFVDYQRCFVWRDEAYKTATISCGQMPEVLLAN